MNKKDFFKPAVLVSVAICLGVGVVMGSVFTMTLLGKNNGDQEASSANEPLYWVAPMDSNYKRDKPGKSPMGMDLVPVYAEDSNGANTEPGTVVISPEVINNLGVRTVKTVLKPLNNTIRTVGYVKYDEDRLVHMHPRVEGWVNELYVKASGDPIVEDQPVYTLYSPQLVNAQEEFVLALNRNNERLIEASVQRLLALQISKKVINWIKNSRQVMHRVTFYAPVTGVVENLNIREGFFVKPGTTLMSIGNLDEVWVEAEVFERQAFQVKLGMLVTMTLDYLPGRKWQGQVDYVYPTVDPKNRTVHVRVRVKNEDKLLKPNMFAQVIIHAEESDSKLLIPKESVIRTGDQDRVVLALGEGRFKSIEVLLGESDQDYFEVLGGLNEGDEVVSSAQFLLDSESSKTSDFKRMHQPDMKPESVWVEAKVESVMAGHKMLTLTHQPIAAWGWPEMTMDFFVDDAVELTALNQGMTIHVQITKTAEKKWIVSKIHIPDNALKDEAVNKQMNHDGMDHSQMNHDGIDHSQMNHEGMDHSQMSHEGMDHNQMNHEGMDHSQMNHEGMDHSQMNHEGMDHSQMNHEGMDHSKHGTTRQEEE